MGFTSSTYCTVHPRPDLSSDHVSNVLALRGLLIALRVPPHRLLLLFRPFGQTLRKLVPCLFHTPRNALDVLYDTHDGSADFVAFVDTVDKNAGRGACKGKRRVKPYSGSPVLLRDRVISRCLCLS